MTLIDYVYLLKLFIMCAEVVVSGDCFQHIMVIGDQFTGDSNGGAIEIFGNTFLNFRKLTLIWNLL
jgi:hypothetical protein